MIIEAFLEEIPSKISSLSNALERKDADLIRRQAHTLKGASANIGALSLQEIAHQIELAAQAGGLDKTSDLISRLNGQLKAFKEALIGSGIIKDG